MERVRKKGGGNAEHAIQRAVFQHIHTRGAPGVFAFHPKNGGVHQRGARSGINSGLGVVSGVPDIIIIRPITLGAMLYGQIYALELKTEKGNTSDEQRDVLQRLKTAGAIVAVAHGLDEAVKQLEEWQLLKGRIA